MRIASFNVENLFARPRALNLDTWAAGKPILEAYRAVNELFQKAVYGAADKKKMVEHLLTLEIYAKSGSIVRENKSRTPRWAWLRADRGKFHKEPKDTSKSVEIVATGRGDWIGWVELVKDQIDELATRMTAQVIKDINADVIAVVEADDRKSLVRLNETLLDGMYGHVMLIDGNDDRGIDVGILTKAAHPIESIRSNVDARDATGRIFSRDCAQYEIAVAGGKTLNLLVNHFKSQSGGGGPQRRRQANEVRRIVDGMVADGKDLIVLGDLNEGFTAAGPSQNFAALFDAAGPLQDCYAMPAFETGPKPGTFDDCGLRNRLDYMFLSRGLTAKFQRGAVFRKGLWGDRKTRPTEWDTYPEMAKSADQASDHAAVYVDLNF